MEFASCDELSNDLVSYLTSLLSEEVAEPVIKQFEAQKYVEGLEAILAQASALIALEEETDVEGLFKLFIALALKLSEEEYVPLVASFFQAIAAQSSANLLKLHILCNSFNMLVQPTSMRFDALMVLLKTACDAGEFKFVREYLAKAETLFPADALSVAQQRQLYEFSAESFDKYGSNSELFLNRLVFLLKTFEDSAAAELDSAKDMAVRGIVAFVNSPITDSLHRLDLLQYKAVQHLKTDSKHQLLVELLELFLSSTLAEFEAFAKKNQAALEGYGIDAEVCLSNMRVLLLCSFDEEIGYDSITKALHIQDDEVEQVVVKAITSKLIEAKINQLARVVTIRALAPRNFGKADWTLLSEKLTSWKTNLGSLLTTIRSAREARSN